MQLWQWCNKRPTSFITRQAGCTAYLLPFDTDMLCLLVTDAAQHWSQRTQMTFWIVFFSVTKHYLFDDGHQCNPRHPDGAVGCYCLSSEITFTSYVLWVCVWDELSEWMCVCLCACTWKALHVDICVQDDASLTTPAWCHSLIDAWLLFGCLWGISFYYTEWIIIKMCLSGSLSLT